MKMIDKLRQQKISHENVDEATGVINNEGFSFGEKLEKVQVLESKSPAAEQVLFAEIYSSLHHMAITQEDIDLMAGV